jgi:hypothetical protein
MYKKIAIYIYMTLVFNVLPKHQVYRQTNVKKVIVNPRMTKKMQMFPNMGAVKKMSCGCGK